MNGGILVLCVLLLIASIAWSVANANEARDAARSAGQDPDDAWRRVFFSRRPGIEAERVEREVRLEQAHDRLVRDERATAERLWRAEQEAADARADAQRVRDARPVAERLEQLQGLYDKGLVNEDEFADKRREILGDV